MKRLKFGQILGLALVASCLSARAQTTAFSYQGKLTVSGSPANGNYDFNFKLYDDPAATSGHQVGTPVSLASTPVANGLFTVKLDFGSGPFTGAQRWLEIDARPSGSSATPTVLSPRTELTPVPYAIYAQTAGSVANGAIGNFQLASGAVTSAKIAPGQVVTSLNGLTDAITLSAGPNVTLTPSGKNIQISSSGGSGPFALNGSSAYYNGGNVGIGTPAPESTLHVKSPGTTYLTLDKPSVAYETGLAFRTGGNPRWWAFADNDTDDFQIESAGENDGQPRIRLPFNNHNVLLGLSGGNVGIGTTSPTFPLTVQRNDYNDHIQWQDGSYILGRLGVSGLHNGWMGLQASGNWTTYIRASGNSFFNGGNVGIGTTAPQFPLTVQTGSGYGIIHTDGTRQVGTYVNVDGGWIGTRSNDPLNFFVNDGGAAMSINTDNSVSMGVLSVGVLTITGGADLAEPFNMSTKDIPKGSLVVIDKEHPGQLTLSQRAYDKCLAGIVSGANGIRAGLSLHQEGALEGGQNVALTGRVYALADASSGAIEPGDLLTSSDTPGHCMKATDGPRAQGAIIGKAMSSLAAGEGYVLVLVSLQ